jgi:competence protein ComEC
MADENPPSNFSRYPMLWLAVACAVGILLAKTIDADLPITFSACAVLAIGAFMLRESRFAAALMLAAFAAAGLGAATLETRISPERLRALYDSGTIRSGDPVELEGVLMGGPELSIDGAFLNLRSEKIGYHGEERNVSGNVRLFLPASESSDELYLAYGSRVRAACKLEREDEFLDPGVMRKRDILDRLGVDATGSIKSPLLVEKLADESVFLPLAWVYGQRAQLIADFKNNLDRSAAGVMIASLLGDKNFLDKDTADLFREGGTFHILVISGLHITFIGGLLYLFLRRITKNRWVQFIVTTLILWAYTLAVGADVPVVRASIMFTIVLFSYVIYRQGSLLNSLGICALLLLVWRPSDLFNPSLHLTFVSVLAIVAVAYPLLTQLRKVGEWMPSPQTPFPPNVPKRLRKFCEMLYWKPDAWRIESRRQIWTANLFKSPFLPRRVVGGLQKIVRYVFEGILVSLIVQICMLPLVVVYFHRISIASVLLNIWVGLFIAIESFLAVIGAVLGHMSDLLAAPFIWLANAVNWSMLSVPRLFADNGWASFRLPAYSGNGIVVYVVYFLPILLLAIAVNKCRPFDLKQTSLIKGEILYPVCLSVVVLIGIIAFHPLSAPQADGRLHFDFLDVGQGDSALVTFPGGETLLVDGGGRFGFRKDQNDEAEPFAPDVRGIGEAIVSEYLWYRGYSHIDHILATHADADHIQGLTDVARNFSVDSAIFGRTPMKDPDYAALAAVLERRGIPVETVARGDRWKIGDVAVEVLYPLATEDPDAVSDNDHSVVLRIVYGDRAFLLTGDIEKQAEAAIVNNGGTVAADLIKVAHHGSRTSSTQGFIAAVEAKYAVISVGRSSPFGHPHPEVVERWKGSGATVITTGERGTISVSTDGHDLELTRFVE